MPVSWILDGQYIELYSKEIAMKKIMRTVEITNLLKDKIGCSLEWISKSLNFKRNSDKARYIRTLAILNGGASSGVEMIALPNVDHDTAERKMTWDFGVGLRLVCHTEKCASSIEFLWMKEGKWEEVATAITRTPKELMEMQTVAQRLASVQ